MNHRGNRGLAFIYAVIFLGVLMFVLMYYVFVPVLLQVLTWSEAQYASWTANELLFFTLIRGLLSGLGVFFMVCAVIWAKSNASKKDEGFVQ